MINGRPFTRDLLLVGNRETVNWHAADAVLAAHPILSNASQQPRLYRNALTAGDRDAEIAL